MTPLISKLLVAWCMMAVCVAIHAAGLTMAFRWLERHTTPKETQGWHATWTLIRIAGWTMLLHLLQISAWAIYYTWQGAMPDFTSAAYFSAVTYTTTGYGDLVLKEEWRLVGGVEALTGILMCGLSASLFFIVFTRVFSTIAKSEPAE